MNDETDNKMFEKYRYKAISMLDYYLRRHSQDNEQDVMEILVLAITHYAEEETNKTFYTYLQGKIRDYAANTRCKSIQRHTTSLDTLSDDYMISEDETIEDIEKNDVFSIAITSLSKTDRNIISMRYGIYPFDRMHSYEEIGVIMGKTKSSAHRKIQEILQSMRKSSSS
jgi:RNA polymerase sigma factor (sigma-70 family)